MSLAVTKRGNALYEPDGEKLEQYLWDRSELVVIQGPIGSGTSTCSCMRIYKLACEQEPDFDNVRRTRWLILRSTYKQLGKTTIKTWLEWFPEETFGDIIRAEPGVHHLRFPHPSGDGTTVDCEVIFIAIDSPEKAEQEAASFEITGFWFNEGQFAEKEVIDELLSRCGRFPSKRNGPGATWHGGMIDLNAPIEGHWIPYMRGDVPMPAEWSEEEKAIMTKPDEWTFIVQPPGLIESKIDGKTVYQPNPHAENQKNLRKSYMEQIRGKQKSWIDRRIMNRVILSMGGKPVYPTYSEYEHADGRDLPPVDGFPIVIGLDFGRDPGAAFMQCVNGNWTVLSEIIGDNESAQRFAPRVARHMSVEYPGFTFEAYGDPRGADRGQNVETTAYEVFQAHGIRVFPATTDNNPEMRRSAFEAVLERRNGFRVNHKCLTLRRGLAGGYQYKKMAGTSGLYSPQPIKNRYSHIVESVENGLLGGGEGYAVTRMQESRRLKPSAPRRHSIRNRRSA